MRKKPAAQKPSETLALFGRRLREWREERGKKIAEAAGEMGVATSCWGCWETGQCLPSTGNFLLLAQYTGIPIHHFFCPGDGGCFSTQPPV